jgi:hypothetical protein
MRSRRNTRSREGRASVIPLGMRPKSRRHDDASGNEKRKTRGYDSSLGCRRLGGSNGTLSISREGWGLTTAAPCLYEGLNAGDQI